jgi:REP element-mobilizing transposase RayT
MARKLRVEYEGAIYHLTVRANGRKDLFADDTDRRYLLDRIAQATETYQVRIYLFCLMSNHFHLVAETPRGNIGRFMQSVMTGYGVYYNRRHRLHGHVTQGRYGAKLVEGNEYLLKLSRYVHLNPVKIARMKAKSLQDRLEILRKYSWSSFQAYAGLAPRNDFVHYEAVLALMEGRKDKRQDQYRQFVEAGVATNDQEFAAAMWQSALCIGSLDFLEEVEDHYRTLVEAAQVREDVLFRRVTPVLSADRILDAVTSVAGVERKDLMVQQRDCRWRALAARMLCRYGGLTQRSTASILGLRTGVAVSCQLRRLAGLLESDQVLQKELHRIEVRLDKEQRREHG